MDKKVYNFLEKAKVSAERFASYTGKAAACAADNASKGAAGVMQTTKLNLQIFDLNTEIEILYKEIGKLVYAVHCGMEGDQDELQVKLELIDEKREKIEQLREARKQSKDTVICPNCASECEKEDAFCKTCGAQL